MSSHVLIGTGVLRGYVMKGWSKRRVIGACMSVGAVVFAPVGNTAAASKVSAAVRPTFAAPITLPSSTGGEPSIAIDTTNCSGATCHIYIDSPNAMPLGTGKQPAMWHSSDDGATWGSPVPIDNVTPCDPRRGGDTDVDTLPNGSVSAADLNVTWTTVQLSTDHAATFPGCTQANLTAFEDDRPWLAHTGNSTIYLAYHDFVLEVPIVCTSTTASGTNPGTFTCVQAFGTTTNPGGTGTQLTNCVENTVPARNFVVDPVDASLNFMYSCSTAAQNGANPPFGALHDYYLARSTNGVTYTTKNVFIADTSGGKAPNLANIFGNLVSDSAGNYYALWSGTLDDNHVLSIPDHVYLSVSKDKGTTWSTPVVVDNETTPDQNGFTGRGSHTLAHLAVTTPGNVDIIWYGTTNTGEPNGQCGSTGMVTTCADSNAPGVNVGMDFHASGSGTNTGGSVMGNWQVSMAQSTNALCQLDLTPCTAPSFTTAFVDPNYRHFGTICTNGIVCGGVSDRHLADFISVAVDCSGLAHVTYGADQNSATVPAETSALRADGSLTTVETNQNGGTALAAPATCPQAAVTPEVPLVPLLPIGAALVGGVVAIARHRRRRAAAT